MKKNLYWMAAAFITLTAVGCTNAKKADVSAAGNDTTQVVDMHTAETSLDYYGVYKGTTPAADCPGIELTLTLKKDRTYTYHWLYIDRKDAEFDETGTFTVKDNLLTLTEKGGEVSYFKVQEGSLVMLNDEKQPATGALADAYVLKQEEVFRDFPSLLVIRRPKKN